MAVACLAGFHAYDLRDRASFHQPQTPNRYRLTQRRMGPRLPLSARLIVSSVGLPASKAG